MAEISERTARQIVDTVKDVCGYNINFIRSDGIILASTNPLFCTITRPCRNCQS
ncbi:MAG: hypothetical protein LIV24_06235 [Eubacterium sp.]|nr:hypothetical protein [Eubacterium sp.]